MDERNANYFPEQRQQEDTRGSVLQGPVPPVCTVPTSSPHLHGEARRLDHWENREQHSLFHQYTNEHHYESSPYYCL